MHALFCGSSSGMSVSWMLHLQHSGLWPVVNLSYQSGADHSDLCIFWFARKWPWHAANFHQLDIVVGVLRLQMRWTLKPLAPSSHLQKRLFQQDLHTVVAAHEACVVRQDLMVNLPAAAPVDSKKPQEAHEAAMGATAKTKSSKQLAPGSHAAAPSTPASAPAFSSKSSSQATGDFKLSLSGCLGMMKLHVHLTCT